MADRTLHQIAALTGMTTAELQQRWRDLMGTEPPGPRREFLIKRLAYRIQELAYGGLSQSTRQKMNDILEEAGYDEIGAPPGNGRRARGKPDLPLIGTRLVREWNGGRYEVTVVSGGFEFQGRRYRSLTAITKVITGTHWNGRAFFGLRPPKERGNGR